MSSSDEDRPPPRDPLLDDPAFAELVGPPPPQPPQEPVFAEPVEEPVESLPVAEVIRPKAVPVQPAAPAPTKLVPRTTMPVPVETEPPKPQWFGACSVIGCFGVLSIGAVAVLLWIAITLLSNLGDKIGDTKATSKTEAKDKVARGPVAATVLVNDVEIPLAGRVDAVARGGGGRFLLLRSTNQRKIEVFDANAAQIVFSIPSGEPGTLFAAGSEKIFVCDPLGGKLHRYGLFSGELEASETLPNEMPSVRALAIGGESTGPLRVVASAARKMKIHQFDPVTLKSIGFHDFSFPLDAGTPVLARMSNNGSVLGVSYRDGAAVIWYGTGNPTSKLLAPIAGDKPRWAIPSPDGQFTYTPRGVYDTGGSPFTGTQGGIYTFPPAHGDDWFLTLDVADESVTGVPRRHAAGVRSLANGTQLEKAFLSTEFPANELKADGPPAADRIHYWPGAGLVAVLPYTLAEGTAKLQLFKVPVAEK